MSSPAQLTQCREASPPLSSSSVSFLKGQRTTPRTHKPLLNHSWNRRKAPCFQKPTCGQSLHLCWDVAKQNQATTNTQSTAQTPSAPRPSSSCPSGQCHSHEHNTQFPLISEQTAFYTGNRFSGLVEWLFFFFSVIKQAAKLE